MPVLTVVRGTVVVRDGHLVGQPAGAVISDTRAGSGR
jgi:hypothetical protein